MKQAIRLRPAQMQVFESRERFRVLVAGRRFGKTQLGLVELLRGACRRDRLVWYLAPSYRQGKRIAWHRLKELTRPYWLGRPNEGDLSIRLRWGSTIAIRGADRYEALRGDGLDFVVLDEYASVDPRCWTEVIRPALSDRGGGALFMGTPQGFNHFYDRFNKAKVDPGWKAFQFTTLEGGNVSAAELESAKGELDERCYRQEFGASFESVGVGRAYYAFDRTQNVMRCEYDAGVPLIWSVDFNVNPMCSTLAQRVGNTVYVLDEMVLPDSNTPEMCEAFFARSAFMREIEAQRRKLRFTVKVYGDASGNRRSSAASRTDWKIIRDFFAQLNHAMDGHVWVGTANPLVKDRINCMNSLLKNAQGERRLQIDSRCRELIRDLEQVCWKADASGNTLTELDKSDPMRTHVSDALGYYVAQEFPMWGSVKGIEHWRQ